MANIFNAFNAGGDPTDYFAGDVTGNTSIIKSYKTTTTGIFFGAPVVWDSTNNGVAIVSAVNQRIFGIAVSHRNVEIKTNNPTAAYEFPINSQISILSLGIINMLVATGISIAPMDGPFIYGLGTNANVGQLGNAAVASVTINARNFIRPITASSNNSVAPFWVDTKFGLYPAIS